RFLRGELPAPGCCELIVARAAVVGRRTPRSLDPMLGEQALERRVERPALDLELAIRRLLDERRDPVPVLRSPAEDPEDQKVERSLQQVQPVGRHAALALY